MRLLAILISFFLIFPSIGLAKDNLNIKRPSWSVNFEQDEFIIKGRNGQHRFMLDLALTKEQRAQGMMFRTEVPLLEGMFFPFSKQYAKGQRPRLWMKNTYIPLDILFTDPKGKILQIIHSAPPLTTTVITPQQPTFAVIEIPGGTARALRITPGYEVKNPRYFPSQEP